MVEEDGSWVGEVCGSCLFGFFWLGYEMGGGTEI